MPTSDTTPSGHIAILLGSPITWYIMILILKMTTLRDWWRGKMRTYRMLQMGIK
jgi:hypothetical protein